MPEQLQRAMAAEAEAARNARAKVIAAEGEHKASRSLRQAAEVIMDSPAALQVRRAVFYKVEELKKNIFCPFHQFRVHLFYAPMVWFFYLLEYSHQQKSDNDL